MKFDFSGWATRNNLKCSDGRTIIQDAFKDNDGQKVPLVWNHQHNDPANVLGHALLENRKDGVYAYCTLNDTEAGKDARLLIEHGDVSALSIYANGLKQQGANVMHGVIREVSLVLAGANPGAFIDSVMSHGVDSDEEAIIFTGEDLELSHGCDNNKEEKKLKDEDEKKVPESDEKEVNTSEKEDTTSEKDEEDKKKNLEHGKSVQDVIDTMNEEQQNVLYGLVGSILEGKNKDNTDSEKESEETKEDNKDMKHNVFDQDEQNMENVLSHAEQETIIADAKRYGSMKDSFIAHAADYGIEDVEYLFPEAKSLNTPPDFISRKMDWVQEVMSATKHTPFSRIKSMFADITEDEARAKGYIKGNKKKDEVFSLLKRTTTPTTIYKKQKMDRDDVVDITDFDVIAWLKSEMRMMLDEEIARAILIGDGRLSSSDDKINEQNIRPVWKDDDLYTIKKDVTFASGATDSDKAKAFIKAAIKARKDYRGSGEPTLYTTEDMITDCLLIEDTTGRTIYDSVEKLANVMRVKKIVAVPVLENQTREADGKTKNLLGLIVNLADYNVGADKGGQINMFDDFDIDYNQQKYLIETRCSGAMIKPYAAIALETEAAEG